MRDRDDVTPDLTSLHDVEYFPREAQISSDRGAATMMSTARPMIGTGSIPASAIRPANTEMYDGAPSLTASVSSSTCAVVNTAVTLTFTPPSDSSRTSAAIDSPLVVETGILTYTLSPHLEIISAWRRISSALSAKTSNEMGCLVIRSSSRFANSS